MADHRFPGWPKGLNNVARPDQVPSDAMTKAVNVDLMPDGKPARRKGRTQVYSGTDMHSAYGAETFFLAVENGALKRWVDFNVTPLTIATGVAGVVSYVQLNDMVVWGSASHLGAIDMQGQPINFGLQAPTAQPDLTAITVGGMYEGTYQVAVTFVTNSGVESGTGKAAVVEVQDGGGIQITSIPQPEDDDATGIVIYASQANGSVLYARMMVEVGTTSVDLGYLPQRRPLSTQFTTQLPKTNLIASYNGRMYAMDGAVVHFSEPLKFWSTHETEGFFYEASAGNMLLAGETGIFVGCDQGVFFYRGDDPGNFTRSYVSHPAITDAALSLDGEFIDPSIAGQTVALWWTVEGVLVAGMPDGSIEPIREAEFRIPDAERGVMAPLTREGIKQVVSVMKNPGTESSMGFSSSMDIEVHRHGV